MDKSDNIANLTEALAKVQMTLSDLTGTEILDLWNHYREILAANGLAVVQYAEAGINSIVVETVLMHVSNEFIAGKTSVSQPNPATMQLAFVDLSFVRRYALSSLLGLATQLPDSSEQSPEISKQPIPAPKPEDLKNPRELKAEEIFAGGGVVKKKENTYEVTETTLDGGIDVCTVTTSATSAVKCNCDDYRAIIKNNKDFKCEHILAARFYYKAHEMPSTS